MHLCREEAILAEWVGWVKMHYLPFLISGGEQGPEGNESNYKGVVRQGCSFSGCPHSMHDLG